MRCWLNGALVDPAQALLSAYDHGLVVGDGVFETCKVVDGVPFALTRHLQRLQRSARGLGLAGVDLDALRAAVAEVCAEPDLPAAARLRVTVTAGPAPLGSGRGDGPATLFVAAAPLAEWAPTCAVVTVPWPRNERGALAGVKTTSYAENVVALAYAREREAAEAVFANTAGNLCEGTGSNVFVVRDGLLVTPPLSAGCLAGVTRDLVLEWVEGAVEEDVPMPALADATEVFLTSTTRDVQPVHAVDGRQVATAPGPVTRRAMDAFVARAAAPDP